MYGAIYAPPRHTLEKPLQLRLLAEIQRRLLEHQRRQKLGDRVHSMTTLARKADVNPSTRYAVIAGERVNHHSQIMSTRMF